MLRPFTMRRLQKELDMLKERTPFTKTEDESSMVITFYTLGRCFDIIIGADYPFKPPVVKRNGLELRIVEKDFLREFENKYKTCGCYCCLYQFLTNWSPCFTIVRVFEKVDSFERDWFALTLESVQKSLPNLPYDLQYMITEFL